MLSPAGQTARVEYRQQHTAEWAQHFARAGHPDVRPLAAGVEGAVYLASTPRHDGVRAVARVLR
jgi:hypothetical protein